MALDFQYDELMLERSRLFNLMAGDVTYGYAFTLRYPSYRGTFLSCIEALEVAVDGAPVAVGDMRFTLRGREFLVPELAELSHEHWFVLDDALLSVMAPGGLPAGEHDIAVRLVHRVPYTGYFGEYLTLESRGTARRQAEAGGGCDA